MMKKGENANRPESGDIIIVEPIREKKTLKDLRTLLRDKPLDYALFMVGINTNLRAGDMLNLKVKQVKDLQAGETITIREGKTKKLRDVKFNKDAVDAIQNLIDEKNLKSKDYLFVGQRGVLSVPALNLKIKRWMKRLGVKGNFGCHSLRKTWAYFQYNHNQAPLPRLMEALNHSSQKVTLRYLGIQAKEISDMFDYCVGS